MAQTVGCSVGKPVGVAVFEVLDEAFAHEVHLLEGVEGWQGVGEFKQRPAVGSVAGGAVKVGQEGAQSDVHQVEAVLLGGVGQVPPKFVHADEYQEGLCLEGQAKVGLEPLAQCFPVSLFGGCECAIGAAAGHGQGCGVSGCSASKRNHRQ